MYVWRPIRVQQHCFFFCNIKKEALHEIYKVATHLYLVREGGEGERERERERRERAESYVLQLVIPTYSSCTYPARKDPVHVVYV